MPYVKKELYDFMASQLKKKVMDAQYNIAKNKIEIKRLAIEQNRLKKQLSEASRMIMHFRNKERFEG